jgi:glucose/arabinose dehydrogenase
MMFYDGKQFPAHYRGGAFIVMHGGNAGHPAPGGYNVIFVPFANGKAGTPEVFADGFAGPGGRSPDKASYRPVGGTVGPDGSLYIADSQKGRIWRIYYSNQTSSP